jgi:hypothetical protein
MTRGRPRIRGELTKAQWRNLRRVKSKPQRGSSVVMVDNVAIVVERDWRLATLKGAVTRIERQIAALLAQQPRGPKPKWIKLRVKRLSESLIQARAALSERTLDRTKMLAAQRQKMIDQINSPPVPMPVLPADWRQR